MDHLSVPELYQPFPSVGWRNTLQQDKEVPALVRALGLMQGQRMLEVGCGRGVALESFARLCCPARLVGLDLDADALAQARQQLTTRSVAATLVQGDVRALPFEDGYLRRGHRLWDLLSHLAARCGTRRNHACPQPRRAARARNPDRATPCSSNPLMPQPSALGKRSHADILSDTCTVGESPKAQ